MQFIDFPSAGELVASTSPWSAAFFTALQDPMYFALGVIIGVGVIGFLIVVVGKALFKH